MRPQSYDEHSKYCQICAGSIVINGKMYCQLGELPRIITDLDVFDMESFVMPYGYCNLFQRAD